jgi:hypothetical protein
MARFKNNTGRDVYLDLGGLRRIAADEIVDLVGTYSMPPLTLVEEYKPKPKPEPKPRKTKKTEKPQNCSVSGTI